MASLLGGATYRQGGMFSTGEGTNSSVVVSIMKSTGSDALFTEGLVAQNISANISKQDRDVYEVGTNYYYRIQGRNSGNGTIQHLVGPNKQQAWKTMKIWADPCDELKIRFQAIPYGKCDSHAEGDSVCFTGGHLTSVQVQATAGEVVITGNLGFTFLDLTDE